MVCRHAGAQDVNLVHTQTMVQIRSTATELWPTNRITNNDRRHLESTSGVIFDHVAYFR